MIDLDYLWCCLSPNFHASDCSLLVHLSAFSSLNIISCGYHYTLHIQLSLSSHFLTTRPTYSDRSVSPAWFVWDFDAVVRSQHATSLIYSLSCYFLFASRVCIICICASNYPMLIRLNLHSSGPHLVFLLTARYIILFVSTHSKVYHSILPVCRVFVSLIDR